MKKIIMILLGIGFFISARSQSWLLTGNSGTDDKIHFIGTTDNQPIMFRIRNNFAGMIDSAKRLTHFGYKTGSFSGTGNSAFGLKALYAGSGSYNAAMGYRSLFSNTDGIVNTAIGSNALLLNTNGSLNTAIGASALMNNVTGGQNTAVGTSALLFNFTGFDNTAIGSLTLLANITGNRNTAVGDLTVGGDTVLGGAGNDNTASGYRALSSMQNGSWNTASGSQAMREITTGSYNTAAGSYALYYSGSSSYNTAIGYNAGSNISVGSNNTFLGSFTKTNGSGYNNVTVVGHDAVATSSNQARIGNKTIISIGGYANWSNISDGRFKKNITANVPGLDFIMQLRPVTYLLDLTSLGKKLLENNSGDDKFNELATTAKAKMRFTGFVAQEVETAAKLAGYDFSGVDKPGNEQDLYGLRYAEFVAPLVKTVQEQEELMNTMEKEIVLLKKQNQVLEERLKLQAAVTKK